MTSKSLKRVSAGLILFMLLAAVLYYVIALPRWGKVAQSGESGIRDEREEELVDQTAGRHLQETSDDTSIAAMGDEVVLRDAEWANKWLELPVSTWREELVQQVGREGIDALFAKLGDFDDSHFAMTSGSHRFVPGAPSSEMRYVAGLRRARRLIALAHAGESEAVKAASCRALNQVLEGWEQALQDEKELWRQAGTAGLIKRGPTPHDRYRAQALASVYILAELGAYESLPLLVKSHERQQAWADATPRTHMAATPVPPAIELYAMHRMVEAFPEIRLDNAAKAQREEYLQWAEENLGKPSVVGVVIWDSVRDEADPLARFVDPQGRTLEKEKMFEMVIFPTEYADDRDIQSGQHADLDERGKQWFALLKAFVDEAFTGDS